jgi:hypothetical protein
MMDDDDYDGISCSQRLPRPLPRSVATGRIAVVSNVKVDSTGSAAVGELSAAAGIERTFVGDVAWKRDCCGMD